MDKQKFTELFRALPPEIQDAISSESHLEKVEEIGKKYNLHIDKIGVLGERILWVALGTLRPSEFIPTLMKDLELSAEEVRPIAVDVNNQIFSPIRESLKQVHSVAPKINEDRPDDSSLPKMPDELKKEPDPLDSFLSSGTNKDEVPPPRPYTQDPYHEPIE